MGPLVGDGKGQIFIVIVLICIFCFSISISQGNTKALLYYHFATCGPLQCVIMSAMASQITSLTIDYSAVYSGTDRRKRQSCVSLAFARGIHRWPVNSPHKGTVTRKIFPLDYVIMPLVGSPHKGPGNRYSSVSWRHHMRRYFPDWHHSIDRGDGTWGLPEDIWW